MQGNIPTPQNMALMVQYLDSRILKFPLNYGEVMATYIKRIPWSLIDVDSHDIFKVDPRSLQIGVNLSHPFFEYNDVDPCPRY